MTDDDLSATGRRYLDHLSDADLVLLGGGGRGGSPEALRGDPARLEAALASPDVFAAVLASNGRVGGGVEGFAEVSPFLVFALAVHRAEFELRGAVAVEEWVGPRRRLPVLGAGQLADFLADRGRRLFLTELLASYTHVSGGSVLVPTGRGWRRRRFSELDPVQLASLIEMVPEAERPGVYRRLGDLALFLTGVFPDSSTTRQFPSVAQSRLLRSGKVTEDELPDFDGIAGMGTVGLLEYLGERWYRLACATAEATASLRVVADVADRFADARRTLNLLADRYLFPFRNYWSGGPAA